MSIIVGIYKNLEIIIIKHDIIVILQIGPYMRVQQFGSDIQAFIIPGHFYPGIPCWSRFFFALNIFKVRGPCYILPGRIIDLSIDFRCYRVKYSDVLLRGN